MPFDPNIGWKGRKTKTNPNVYSTEELIKIAKEYKIPIVKTWNKEKIYTTIADTLKIRETPQEPKTEAPQEPKTETPQPEKAKQPSGHDEAYVFHERRYAEAFMKNSKFNPITRRAIDILGGVHSTLVKRFWKFYDEYGTPEEKKIYDDFLVAEDVKKWNKKTEKDRRRKEEYERAYKKERERQERERQEKEKKYYSSSRGNYDSYWSRADNKPPPPPPPRAPYVRVFTRTLEGENIKTKSEYIKWMRSNHPDKKNNLSQKEIDEATELFKQLHEQACSKGWFGQ